MTMMEKVSQYGQLKSNMSNLPQEAQIKVQENLKQIRNEIVKEIQSNTNGFTFNNALEVYNFVNVILDTGKFMSIDWIRRTNSKTDPTKISGSIDTLVVKKVEGYVKGTSNGTKMVENFLSGRLTVWVANGELQKEGFGNWRTIYAKDVKSVNVMGKKVNIRMKDQVNINLSKIEENKKMCEEFVSNFYDKLMNKIG